MEAARKGRQTPTQSVTLPYTKTHGQEAVDLYNRTGRIAQEWQELLLYDILAENDDGLWVHTKFGYSVPRRNGKNEIVAIRELYGLFHGERILHTAHRTTTSGAAWKRLCDLLIKLDVKEEKYTVSNGFKTGKSKGQEFIELCDELGGGRVDFRTRTTTGGLGEGFDLLIIDEAQEYQTDQESALKYVVTDSQNPQTIFCGTPPTAVSSGTVFVDLRKNILTGKTTNAGWAEWSVDQESDPEDRELWYETNPSLGTILRERSIVDELGGDTVDFNIQRLGLWLRYNQKSEISRKEWDALCVDTLPALVGRMSVGIKYNKDGNTVSLAIAVRTRDKKIFVEVVGRHAVKEGNQWILDFLRAASNNVSKIVVDGANGQKLLEDGIRAEKLKKPLFPTVAEYIQANAVFEQNVAHQILAHMDQPGLTHIVSNCEKRMIGNAGGFGYKAIKADADSSVLDAVILASWAVEEYKPKKQKIRY